MADNSTLDLQARHKAHEVVIDAPLSGDARPLKVSVLEDAYINYQSTILDDPDDARSLARALELAADVLEELRECGDSQHAPKLDAARQHMEVVCAEDCPGQADAARALERLDDPDATSEELDRLVSEWLR
jgi:hypothetical protein